MPLIPIATFLAGSLLSLLLPVLLLIALVVWYWTFIRKVPDTADAADVRPTPPAAVAAAGPTPAEGPERATPPSRS